METQAVEAEDRMETGNRDRENALAALMTFAAQRSGMEPGNYGDWRAYRQESRRVTQDLHDVRRMFGAVAVRDSIGVPQIMEACRAYSGRLTLKAKDGGFFVEYCTGQYFPTEYRRAVCAVLASALWDHTRVSCPETPTHNGKPCSPGDWIRRRFRNELGARLARRYSD